MNSKLMTLAALKQSITYLDHPEVCALGFAVHPKNCSDRAKEAIRLLEESLSEDERREFRLGGGEIDGWGRVEEVEFETLVKPEIEDYKIEETNSTEKEIHSVPLNKIKPDLSLFE